MTAATTYATLQTRLGEDCNRTDTAFVNATPGFIQSAEAEMNRRLRVRQMIARATATIDNEYELLPTGFMGLRSIELTGSPILAVEYLAPDALTGLKEYYSSPGKPKYYTIVGDEFQFLPAPGESYTASLSFWQKIPALSASTTTNWMLDAHPDAYTWGSLIYAYTWLQDEGRRAQAFDAFNYVLDSIANDDRSQSYGATMQTRSGITV